MVWLLELLVLSPSLGGIQLLLFFLILLIMMLLENLILDFAKAFRSSKVKKSFKTLGYSSVLRSLHCIARYSFSPFWVFPIGFFLERVLMRPSWGISIMVLFWQNHLDSP